MSTLVKQLKNQRKVIFDRGKFDEWCVWVVEPDGIKVAPRDEEYFSDLYKISKTYAPYKVYNDFLEVFNRTTNTIEENVLSLIDSITSTYLHGDQKLVEQWFTVVYAGMVAEENKEHAVLKKRVKRLGVYQVLILGMSAAKAASFSKGKPWRELDAIMKNYGF
ncbi:hypothetical protein [Marinilabilia sp.]|uniref:DUF7004 family protein n=1 Tax=Marinilabilia sp. TaxID=2021252 RepID=UPI0025C33F1A|nr:hypothetical protein [Marinilabilia sp.]